ncbi:MAG: FG-GAP-like repeat-containing protein [Planctomycetota bacterium]
MFRPLPAGLKTACFLVILTSSAIANEPSARTVVVGDLDLDGRVDLLLLEQGALQVRWNRGAGQFDDVTASWGLGELTDVSNVRIEDLDQDGLPDLVLGTHRSWQVFRQDVAGRFTEQALPERLARRGAEVGIEVLDLDGDVWPDLVLRSAAGDSLVCQSAPGAFELLSFDFESETVGAAAPLASATAHLPQSIQPGTPSSSPVEEGDETELTESPGNTSRPTMSASSETMARTPSAAPSASASSAARTPTPIPSGTSGASSSSYCPPSIQDRSNPTDCLPASSIPVLGHLFPLSPELFVDPGGAIGLGTLSPSARLDVRNANAMAVTQSLRLPPNPAADAFRIVDAANTTRYAIGSDFGITWPGRLTTPGDMRIEADGDIRINAGGDVRTNRLNGVRYASHFASLQAAIDDAGLAGTVIVDRVYTDLDPIVLPRRFRLIGDGPQGNAAIAFRNTTGSSITVDTTIFDDDYVTIENLAITGPATGTSIGIDLTNTHIVFLDRLIIRNFDIGIYGTSSFTVFINRCGLAACLTDNIRIGFDANSWRVRDTICSFAGEYGIRVGNGNQNVIEGVRFESNGVAAIHTAGLGTHIARNRFESNGAPGVGGVDIDAAAQLTSLIDNLYSSDGVTDASVTGQTLRLEGDALLQTPAFDRRVTVGQSAAAPTAQVFGSFVGATNSFKSQLSVNNLSLDDASWQSAASQYGSWVLEMEGRPAVAESESAARLFYRNADAAEGKGTERLRIDSEGATRLTTERHDADQAPPAVDIGGAWLRLGDGPAGALHPAGIGIKFHDQDAAHASLRFDSANDRMEIGSSSSSGDQLAIDGNPALTIDLAQRRLGVGVANPSNVITVDPASPTDPVANAWTVYSSRRWKEDIETIDDALEIVGRLRGVRYRWKADGRPDVGLIAEEVGAILPEIVAFEDDGVTARSVDYARLVGVLIEAVKDLEEKVEKLSAQQDE